MWDTLFCHMKLDEVALQRFVRDELGRDHTGHGYLHAVRVVKNARKILQKEKGDERIIVTACYLHDCIDHKLFDNIDEQKSKVKVFLSSLFYTDLEKNAILFIMENISFSSGKSAELTDINARIVCDADRLDAVGAIGIIRTIEYGASRNRAFYNEEMKIGELDSIEKDTSLAHFYDKLLKLKDLMFTETAKGLAEERSLFMERFLQQFYSEL